MEPHPPASVDDESPAELGSSFSVGHVLGRSFGVWVSRCAVLLPLAALFHAVPALLEMRLVRRMHEGLQDSDTFSVFALFGGWGLVMSTLAGWVLPLAFQAVVALAVFRALRGTPARWGASIGHGVLRLPHAFGASLLVVLAMLLPLLLMAYVFARASDEVTSVLFLGFAGAYLAFLACRFLVAVQAAVVEGVGPVNALKRSAELTHGVRWRVFAIVLVVYVVPAAIGFLALRVFGWMVYADLSDFHRTEDVVAAQQRVILLQTAVDIVFASLQAVAAAVTYHALRNAREGTSLDDLLAVFE